MENSGRVYHHVWIEKDTYTHILQELIQINPVSDFEFQGAYFNDINDLDQDRNSTPAQVSRGQAAWVISLLYKRFTVGGGEKTKTKTQQVTFFSVVSHMTQSLILWTNFVICRNNPPCTKNGNKQIIVQQKHVS